MLTGRVPCGGSIAEGPGRIVTQPPLPPSQYRPDLDPGLEAVCLKALSKKVAGRYASMRDLGAALADCLRCNPPPALPRIDQVLVAAPPAAVRGPRPAARVGRKGLWLLLAAGAVAAGLMASPLAT